MTRVLSALRIVAALSLATLAGWSAWGHWTASLHNAPHDAADAVPLYLQGVALREGGDPTNVATLAEIKERPQRWALHADVVSTLYPASMAPPMALLAGSGWMVFLARWRGIVLGGLLVGSAAVGWAGAQGRNAPLGAGLGAVIAVTLFPLTGHALQLGQANLLIAGLLGVAVWAAAGDRVGVAGAVAAVGVAVKLVPGIALWPLLAARRWRGLAGAAGIGAAVLAVTVASIPAARVMANVLDTVRFQQGVTPAWMMLFPGPIPHFLGVLRFSPLGLVTLVITGVCAHATRARAEGPAVRASGMVLLAAWLGAAASAVGVFYGLLLLPALIWLTVWPLADRTPRWTWALVPLALAPKLLVTADDGVLLASFQMFLVGLLVWAASAVQLLHLAWQGLGRAEKGAIALSVVLAVGFTATFVAQSPPFPVGPPGGGNVPAGPPDHRSHAPGSNPGFGPAHQGGTPRAQPPPPPPQ